MVYFARLVSPTLVPLRYVLSSAVTIAYLVRRRPRAVVATNPPIFPPLLAWAYSRITRVPFLLDSHPAAFGVKDNRVARVFLPVHRWLARQAVTTLVTTEDWVRVVESWGGRADVVHEAPPRREVPAPAPLGGIPRVLYVGVFARDEPTAALLDAARDLRHVSVRVTGDLRKCPPALRDSAPENVTFVGYLAPDEYWREIELADLVVSLTTEPTSVMRAAYEAVYACRPLVVSDFPALRAVFPDAVHVANQGQAIADGLEQAIADHARLRARSAQAAARQEQRWANQLETLRAAVSGREPAGRRSAPAPMLSSAKQEGNECRGG